MALACSTGCTHQEGQITELSDSFRKQLEDKDRELTTLRGSETQLRTQLAEMQGKMQAYESELSNLRSKGGVDVEALAKQLQPLLQANHNPAPATTLPSTASPAPAPSFGGGGTSGPIDEPAPSKTAGSRGKAAASSNDRSGVRVTSGSSAPDNGRRRIQMNWGPVDAQR